MKKTKPIFQYPKCMFYLYPPMSIAPVKPPVSSWFHPSQRIFIWCHISSSNSIYLISQDIFIRWGKELIWIAKEMGSCKYRRIAHSSRKSRGDIGKLAACIAYAMNIDCLSFSPIHVCFTMIGWRILEVDRTPIHESHTAYKITRTFNSNSHFPIED